MNYYYIDFENVNVSGLADLESLNENDIVRIYYSNNPKIDMENVIRLKQTKAKIKFIKILDSIKKLNQTNALDIVLITDVSRTAATLGDNNIYIVSNDSDFDPAIKEICTLNNTHNIKRKTVSMKGNDAKQTESDIIIQSSTNSQIDKSAVEALFSKELKNFSDLKSDIIYIVMYSASRSEINNKISKAYPKSSNLIMPALKPLIKSLPGN